MNIAQKHRDIVEYIKEYESLWCATGFSGYYLVISAEDLWDHYFCKESQSTRKYIEQFIQKNYYCIKYVIGSKNLPPPPPPSPSPQEMV